MSSALNPSSEPGGPHTSIGIVGQIVLLLFGQDAEHDHDHLGEVVEGPQLPNERGCAAIRQRTSF